MKKYMALLLLIIMSVSPAACRKDKKTEAPAPTVQPAPKPLFAGRIYEAYPFSNGYSIVIGNDGTDYNIGQNAIASVEGTLAKFNPYTGVLESVCTLAEDANELLQLNISLTNDRYTAIRYIFVPSSANK